MQGMHYVHTFFFCPEVAACKLFGAAEERMFSVDSLKKKIRVYIVKNFDKIPDWV
jgi:hypothetical protein